MAVDRSRKFLNEDKFGFKYLIGALVAMLRDMRLPGSFTIGVFGAWGSGKSTFMRMLESELAPRDDFVTLFFDAWAFEDEKQGRLFLPMLLELGRVGGREAEKLAVSIVRDLAEGVFDLALQGFTEGVISVKSIKNAVDALFQREPERPLIVSYVSEIEKLVRIVTRGYTRKLVVFIDDLDRCRPPQLAVELLEDLKLLMDLPNTVFVLGVDRKAMLEVIKTTYRLRQGEAELPADFAQRFMEKFIQLPIHLPHHSEHELSTLSDESDFSESSQIQPIPDHHPQKPADIDLFPRVALKIGQFWASLIEWLRSFNRFGIKEMKIEHRISMAEREIEELLEKERLSPSDRERLRRIYGIIAHFRTTLEYKRHRRPSRHLRYLAEGNLYGLTDAQQKAFQGLASELEEIERRIESQPQSVLSDEEIESIMLIAQRIKAKMSRRSEYYYILENNPRRIIIFDNSIDYLLYVFAARAVLGENMEILEVIEINKAITSMLVRTLLPEITDIPGFYKYLKFQGLLVRHRQLPDLKRLTDDALNLLQLHGSKRPQLEKLLIYLVRMKFMRKEEIRFKDPHECVLYFFPNVEDVNRVIENAQEIAYILGII